MKIIGLIILVLVLLGAGRFFLLVQQSKSGTAPGLADGVLAPCPASPNCVSSEAGTDEDHAIEPLPLSAWDKLPGVIEEEGGKIIVSQEAYIAAEFATPTLGFVDDVEFRLAEGAVHVRSASRVGYSDLGANRKRVEALRAALAE
ncbi:MAG: DUF1499 domain-containing protein [Pseudomonadota bacterium]